MKALPSIAFKDISGTAKDVTARHFRVRMVVTGRPFPSKVVSSFQNTNHNAMHKISRTFKTLTDNQKKEFFLQAVSAIFVPLNSGLDKFPKISPERIQVRFSTGYVEVITVKFEPHLNHALRNSLITNEFNILHRQVEF